VQEEIRAADDFLERTDALAQKLGVSIRSLPEIIGISSASLFGYRTGKLPVSRKALVKLERAEQARTEIGAVPVVRVRDEETPYFVATSSQTPEDSPPAPLTFSQLFFIVDALIEKLERTGATADQIKVVRGLINSIKAHPDFPGVNIPVVGPDEIEPNAL
jgi:hypothetical protein